MATKTHADRGQLAKALRYLADDPRGHQGSLQTKKMQGYDGIWEARAGLNGRLTFHYDGDVLVLRTNCRHDEVLASP